MNLNYNVAIKFKTLLAAIILTMLSLSAEAQLMISTYAGTGVAGYSGDGGQATDATVNVPYGVATDASGNVYVADYANNRIRKINSTGIITTIAGNGFAGFSGDGGPATLANIYAPRGITTDGSGNVYFSDYANNRIRKISAAGIITTVAGNGTSGFSGDGGAAIAAQLNFAWGVGLDAAGNLYIADQINCRVRKVNTAGVISTIGGTGIAFFSGDGGPAISAGIQYPMGIAVDGPGNVYICDEGDCRIRKINTAGIISTVGGNGSGGFSGDGGPATLAKLYYPQGIAMDGAGNLFVADLNNNRIREINTAGVINTITGTGIASYSGDGGPPGLATINQATGVAVGPGGIIYIADNENSRIRYIHIASHAPYFTHGHSDTLAFCASESISLDTLLRIFDVDTGQTETWSLVLPPLHGVATTTYTALSTGAAITPFGLWYSMAPGYTGTDSFKVRVTDGIYSDTITIHTNIIAPPNAGTITGIDSLCPGDTFHFTDGAPGGVWGSSNSTVAGISGGGIVTGLTAGTTVINYTVTNACGPAVAYFPLLIKSNCRTGIKNIGKEGGAVEISPNPSSGSFQIKVYSRQTEKARYVITNIAGEKVMELNGQTNMNVPVTLEQPSGIYFISATTDGGKWEGKVMVGR
jgi:hypothetical protein